LIKGFFELTFDTDFVEFIKPGIRVPNRSGNDVFIAGDLEAFTADDSFTNSGTIVTNMAHPGTFFF